MGIKEEMEKLGTEIMGSYDVRAEKIGQIKKETEKMMDGFKVAHSQMSKKLKEDLSKINPELKSKVSGMLNDFHSTQQEMSLEQRKNLAKGVENRKEEVSKMMDDFKVAHSQMSSEVKKMLNDFHSTQQKMSLEQRESLSKYKENLEEDTQKMMDDFKVAHSQMSSEVKKMLNDFHSTQDKVRAELEKVSLSWQQTASTMQKKRSGAKPVPEVLEKKIIKERLPEKTKIVEKLSDKEQTLVLIKKHPEGLKLTEIGVELGKDWRWYIPTVKELMGENKIRKETNLYYPV